MVKHLVLALVLMVSALRGQGVAEGELMSPPVFAELVAGHRYFNLNMIIAKPMTRRLGFFHVTTFDADYANAQPAAQEWLSQTLVNYELWSGLSISGGVGMNKFTGFRPTMGLQYVYADEAWLLIVQPRIDLRDDYNLEGFGLLEYKFPFNAAGTWRFYTRLQTLYSHNTRLVQHDRSYVFLRLGLMYGKVQAGLAAHSDWYGPSAGQAWNFGPFFRVLLF